MLHLLTLAYHPTNYRRQHNSAAQYNMNQQRVYKVYNLNNFVLGSNLNEHRMEIENGMVYLF